MIKNKHFNIFLTATLLAGFLFLAPHKIVFASMEITEIMYDLSGTDTDREWIEIYNPDSLDVDVSKLKLFEASTNHGINISSGPNLLSPLSYAVIADLPSKFMIDNPSYSGVLFDSTFSLSNTGEPLELRDASGTVLYSATYDSSVGASGDGNSLQKINNIWKASIPTPGLENIFVDTGTSTATTTNNNSGGTSTTTSTTTSSNTSNQNTQTARTVIRTIYVSVHSDGADLSDFDDTQGFVTSAGRQRVVYVGTPIQFKVNYRVPKNMESNTRRFSWSFGDGFSSTGEEVVHTYKYPGEYNVILNGESGQEHSVSRTIVKVLIPNVSFGISRAGDIEISNNGNTEINLGLWRLKNNSNEFIFAIDTIVGPGRNIILSSSDTKIGTSNKIYLLNPSGGEVYSVNNTINPILSGNVESSDITIESAETMIAKYREALALRPEQIINIEKPGDTLDKENDSPEIETNLSQTATVLGSISTTTSTGFLSRIWLSSVLRIKSVARLFYDF